MLRVLTKKCLVLAMILAPGSAQLTAKPLDPLSRDMIVEEISYLFEDRYVDAKLGLQSADFILKQLASGNYSAITDNQQFAEQLTRDLQSVNHDKHVRVIAAEPPSKKSQFKYTTPTPREQQPSEQQDNYGFREINVLPGNVGYVDFRYFSGDLAAQKTAASALKLLENTDAIIFDVRQNGGGHPGMVQFICSYFFAKKTHLNSLYWRTGDRTEEFWTLDTIPGKKRPDVPVFILTSKDTFSGAEEFAYNFQTQKRGTLIGEVTGGGANPGGRFRLNEVFSVFVPTGKAINPVTGTNWEGVGVKPDVQLSREQAFEKGLTLAQEAAKQYRHKQNRKKQD